jgi:hypothetical protein
MTTAGPANLQLAIVLPLGVVANQLMKVEADMRLLSMRAGAMAGGESAAARLVAGHVEKISETLDSLRRLLSDFESDLQPRASGSSAKRKPNPDRDD